MVDKEWRPRCLVVRAGRAAMHVRGQPHRGPRRLRCRSCGRRRPGAPPEWRVGACVPGRCTGQAAAATAHHGTRGSSVRFRAHSHGRPRRARCPKPRRRGGTAGAPGLRPRVASSHRPNAPDRDEHHPRGHLEDQYASNDRAADTPVRARREASDRQRNEIGHRPGEPGDSLADAAEALAVHAPERDAEDRQRDAGEDVQQRRGSSGPAKCRGGDRTSQGVTPSATWACGGDAHPTASPITVRRAPARITKTAISAIPDLAR